MTEKVKVTWERIWGDKYTKEFDTTEDAKEWILKRRLREDIKQESWEIH